MALADSLLSAMVRADGDALVMHVGERPYVVVDTETLNLSTHGLNLEAMTGMLAQLLPADAQRSSRSSARSNTGFRSRATTASSLVAARGGDDIWIEIRRRRPPPAAAVAAPVAEPPAPAGLLLSPCKRCRCPAADRGAGSAAAEPSRSRNLIPSRSPAVIQPSPQSRHPPTARP